MQNSQSKALSAFISFPSPYTQTLLLQALVSSLPSLSITLVPPEDDNPPALQWADYDLLSFDKPHENPKDYLISSYIYRKALIRKHQLHLTIFEYLAKTRDRGYKSVLDREQGGWPQGWNVEIQFADELDEMWVDELYELGEVLQRNEKLEEDQRQWFILKPGFADRAQGIRLFSTQDELQDIFESFEPGSDDESDAGPTNQVDAYREFNKAADQALAAMKANGLKIEDSDSEGEDDTAGPKGTRESERDNGDEEEDEEEDEGTGVMTSQLRHFVIQEYIPRPVLFDIGQTPNDPESALSGYKFHLRAYVLLTGAYTVHLSRTMLALFSGSPYTSPKSSEGDMDLRPHLTNTCLQTDAFGAPSPPEELIKLFWELEGLNALSSSGTEYPSQGVVDKQWLDETFEKVGNVVGESIKAGVECGSFGLQLMPNAFEIFGVDLILSFPPSSDQSSNGRLSIPRVTLLEYNASPDFHQSGNRLRGRLAEMFRGVIEISIKPFFGLGQAEGDEKAGSDKAEIGEEKYGWRLVGKGEIRGPSV